MKYVLSCVAFVVSMLILGSVFAGGAYLLYGFAFLIYTNLEAHVAQPLAVATAIFTPLCMVGFLSLAWAGMKPAPKDRS